MTRWRGYYLVFTICITYLHVAYVFWNRQSYIKEKIIIKYYLKQKERLALTKFVFHKICFSHIFHHVFSFFLKSKWLQFVFKFKVSTYFLCFKTFFHFFIYVLKILSILKKKNLTFCARVNFVPCLKIFS